MVHTRTKVAPGGHRLYEGLFRKKNHLYKCHSLSAVIRDNSIFHRQLIYFVPWVLRRSCKFISGAKRHAIFLIPRYVQVWSFVFFLGFAFAAFSMSTIINIVVPISEDWWSGYKKYLWIFFMVDNKNRNDMDILYFPFFFKLRKCCDLYLKDIFIL